MSEKESLGATFIPAIAYGDAFGLPAEGKSSEAIAKLYGKLTELTPPLDHPFFPYEEKGVTSDDTQLSVVVAESLIASNGFSLEDQAHRHLQAFEQTPVIKNREGSVTPQGWGKSTIQALQRLQQGVSPEHTGEKGGAGNGVIMKLAPLAVWHTLQETDQPQRYAAVDQLTTMTHDGTIARFCSRVHSDVLDALLTGKGALDQIVLRSIEDIKDTFSEEAFILYRAVTEPVHSFEELTERYAAGKSGKQYGFYVPETLAITYDIFLASGSDFQTAVQWAANLGGDADSTASIVATMIACSSDGIFETPADFTEVQEYDALTCLSTQFIEAAQK